MKKSFTNPNVIVTITNKKNASSNYSNYQVREMQDKNGKVIAYSAYNPNTGKNIVMKPEELTTFKGLVENNLMDSFENASNYQNTASNALNGLHDDGKIGGTVDSWKQYAKSGDVVLDLAGGLGGGVGGGAVKSGIKNSAKTVVRTTKDKIFKKETIQVPSGKTYNFYGQKIDLDLELPKNKINSATKKPYTNREWMRKGNNPYVKGKDGKIAPTEQHHSQQKGSGPIFEIKQTTHQNPVNKEALHPYGKKKNPNSPVNRKEWNKDRAAINKKRLKRLEKLEKGDK
ncbi:hypothetical protein [uncultured Gammaproteobacteria bacterium]|nr:hypothetical protein [uncultured Gammaproteobacteria bacterium]